MPKKTQTYQPHDKGFKLLLKQKDIFMSFLREFAHGEFANIINEDSLELGMLQASVFEKTQTHLSSCRTLCGFAYFSATPTVLIAWFTAAFST